MVESPMSSGCHITVAQVQARCSSLSIATKHEHAVSVPRAGTVRVSLLFVPDAGSPAVPVASLPAWSVAPEDIISAARSQPLPPLRTQLAAPGRAGVTRNLTLQLADRFGNALSCVDSALTGHTWAVTSATAGWDAASPCGPSTSSPAAASVAAAAQAVASTPAPTCDADGRLVVGVVPVRAGRLEGVGVLLDGVPIALGDEGGSTPVLWAVAPADASAVASVFEGEDGDLEATAGEALSPAPALRVCDVFGNALSCTDAIAPCAIALGWPYTLDVGGEAFAPPASALTDSAGRLVLQLIPTRATNTSAPVVMVGGTETAQRWRVGPSAIDTTATWTSVATLTSDPGLIGQPVSIRTELRDRYGNARPCDRYDAADGTPVSSSAHWAVEIVCSEPASACRANTVSASCEASTGRVEIRFVPLAAAPSTGVSLTVRYDGVVVGTLIGWALVAERPVPATSAVECATALGGEEVVVTAGGTVALNVTGRNAGGALVVCSASYGDVGGGERGGQMIRFDS